MTGNELPEIKHVAWTNFDIGWKVDEATERALVVAAIDNLVKGAAGSAGPELQRHGAGSTNAPGFCEEDDGARAHCFETGWRASRRADVAGGGAPHRAGRRAAAARIVHGGGGKD